MIPSTRSAPSADDVLIERVRKLFEKATVTSNEHEAEAFARKAAELVARHRIDPERLAAGRATGKIAMREIALGRGAYVRARLSLLTTIGDHHDVRVVFKTTANGMVAYLAGYESDLDMVEMLFHSLHQQAATQMARISRSTGAATQSYRRSFLLGFAGHIGVVLEESERTIDDERTIQQVESTALALRERGERVDEFIESSFGPVRSARRPKAAQIGGWQAGAAAAKRADIGRAPLPSRRAIGR